MSLPLLKVTQGHCAMTSQHYIETMNCIFDKQTVQFEPKKGSCNQKTKMQITNLSCVLFLLKEMKLIILVRKQGVLLYMFTRMHRNRIIIILEKRKKKSFPLNYVPFPKQHNSDSSKLKELADDNFKFDENGKTFSKRVEKTVGKREIAPWEQFLLFPKCFQKS